MLEIVKLDSRKFLQIKKLCENLTKCETFPAEGILKEKNYCLITYDLKRFCKETHVIVFYMLKHRPHFDFDILKKIVFQNLNFSIFLPSFRYLCAIVSYSITLFPGRKSVYCF